MLAALRFLGKAEQGFGMEAGGKTLQPHRRDFPVRVATRAFQQIDLPGHAIHVGIAQLGEELGIATSGGVECRFERTCFVGHRQRSSRCGLSRGLLLAATC